MNKDHLVYCRIGVFVCIMACFCAFVDYRRSFYHPKYKPGDIVYHKNDFYRGRVTKSAQYGFSGNFSYAVRDINEELHWWDDCVIVDSVETEYFPAKPVPEEEEEYEPKGMTNEELWILWLLFRI